VKPLRVSHVIRLNESPVSPPLSGAENHLLFLLPALAKHGVDVELIVVFGSLGPLLEETFKKLTGAGVRVTLAPLAREADWHYLGSRVLRRTSELVSLLRSRKDRIVHIHLDYFGAPIAAWLSGCSKVVMSIHNDEDWLESFRMRVWLRLVNLMVGRYIAISNRVRDYFVKVSGARPEKVRRIYYGVEYRNVLPPREARRKFGIPEDRFVVGFLGRLTYQKNVEVLLEVARDMPDVHFAIVGEGELRGALQESVRDLNNVQFLGYQPNGFEAISSFDLFCLPSRFEGLGLVLVEAMIQSVPIVASRAGAIPEILGNGKYGALFDVGDLDGLEENIRYLKGDPKAACSMVDLAREFASSFFTIDKMVAETIDVYEKINS